MADFIDEDLTGSRFERVNCADSRFERINLSGVESRSYPVSECLLTIFNEEWEHRLYAERDLDALMVRSS